MLKPVLLCAALAASATFASLDAKEPPTASQAIKQVPYQKVLVPGTNYEVVLGLVEFSPGRGPSTPAFLAMLMHWISDNFDLPATYDLPKVEFVPAREIAARRYTHLSGWQQEGAVGLDHASQREVVSVYDDTMRTIYLREEWTGSTPAELSVLIHEMVHHLQNLGQLKFACPQERELLAYEAQDRWLGLFGRDLLRDFEIDPFTLLVSTKCFY